MVSTRNTIEIAELLDDGFTIEEAAEVLIYPLFSDEGGNDSERIYIRQIVQKYLPSKSKQELYQVDFKSKDNLELKWAGQSYDGQNYTTE
jgi:hypothetical protein